MTTSEIDNLEAGVELDVAVHKACDIPVVWDDKPKGILSFQPSSNWNDAMEAAEKVELFRTYCLNQSYEGSWWVHRHDMNKYLSAFVKSGPVAICRAILKAKAERA